MKSLVALSFFACIVLITSCLKPKEPIAKICPEEPATITTKDTLVLENCSEFFETQRWELPNGAFSNQNKIAFTTSVPGDYVIILKVKNNNYANDYIAERTVKVTLP